jgi:hypothetical protein
MHQDSFEITNSEAISINVTAEPWATTFQVHTGETLRFVAASEKPGSFEVVREGSDVALYGWPESTLKIFRNGIVIEDFTLPFPDIPPNMSMREFINLLFGPR